MKKIILLFLGVCVLTGCAVNTYVDRYILNNVPCIKCCGGVSPHSLLLSEMTAAPGFDTDQILYLKCPYQLKAYSRNRWVAPPNQMLTAVLHQTLTNTCFFKAVVVPPFPGKTSYLLHTRLLKLQQEFFCCPSRVRMMVQATLVNGCTSCPIATQTFCMVVLAPQNNACGGVIAANKAAKCIMQQITNFVICHINSHDYMLEEPIKYKISDEKIIPPTME